MKKIMNKNGFTLIELLVVIAIIAMLLAIVIPSLRKAKEYAKKVLDKSNMHQVCVAIGNYEAAHAFNFRENSKWYYGTPGESGGTGDMPWESGSADVPDQTRMFRDLIAADALPNHEVLFCPAVANVSYEKNYLRSKVLAGDATVYAMSDMEERIARKDPAFAGQYPALWSTYAFLWKKRLAVAANSTTPGSSSVSVNPVSSGVLFCDITTITWRYATGLGNADATLITNLKNTGNKIAQTFPHFLAAMKDFSVVNPTDKDTLENPEATRWLWNSNTWAGLGGTYPPY
jgi:prepilin-type N-terminal cleavage/methylation domain-containing protein